MGVLQVVLWGVTQGVLHGLHKAPVPFSGVLQRGPASANVVEGPDPHGAERSRCFHVRMMCESFADLRGCFHEQITLWSQVVPNRPEQADRSSESVRCCSGL